MASGSEARSPEKIQAEIERTRAELAATLDTLVERVSPKRVAGRGAEKVKAALGSAVDSVRPDRGRDDGIDEAGFGGYETTKTVRWERLAAAGAVVAVVLLLVRRHRRGH